MSNELELRHLIVLNIGDIDAIAREISRIEKLIWSELGDHVKKWAKRTGWESAIDEDDIQVFPADWKKGGEEPWARFVIGWGPADSAGEIDSDPYFELSRYAGAAGGRLCLWLEFDGIRRSGWRPAFKAAAERSGTGGFRLDDKEGLYIDCTPPLNSLAEAVSEEEFTRAFVPLDRALETARKGWRTLGRLLQQASK